MHLSSRSKMRGAVIDPNFKPSSENQFFSVYVASDIRAYFASMLGWTKEKNRPSCDLSEKEGDTPVTPYAAFCGS